MPNIEPVFFDIPGDEDFDVPHGEAGKRQQSSAAADKEDTIFGQSFARVVALIGEGKHEGFPPGDIRNHIYLGGVPIKYPGYARPNVKNVVVRYRQGIPFQQGIPGFTNIIAQDTNVGVNVQKRSGVVIRSITNSQLDVIRVNLIVRCFWNTGDDIKRNTVTIRISTKSGNAAWKIRETIELKERIQQGYPFSRDYPVNNQNGTVSTFQVRVEKLSDDSTNTKVADITWSSYGTIIDNPKMGYAHTAILGVSLDSEAFQSMPDVQVRQFGITELMIPSGSTIRADRSLQLPTNWNGAVAIAPNAVNCIFPTLLNELTNKRICSNPYTLADIDLPSLYAIANFNNQIVTHADGKQRPRFRQTYYIDSAWTGLEVLENLLAGCFADWYELGGKLYFTQNRRGLSVTQRFGNSQVEDDFDYPETEMAVRYNVCIIRWWNPDTNEWDEAKYEDRPDIQATKARRILNVTAFGCENRYQAEMTAKAYVKIALLEIKLVKFTAVPRAIYCRPGDVIEVFDERHANIKHSGVIREFSGSTLTLDAPPIAVPGDSITYMRADTGEFETRIIQSTNTTNRTVTTTVAPTSVKLEEIWAIATTTIQPQQFRVQTIARVEDSPYVQVIGINHIANLWDVIEADADPYVPPTRGDRTNRATPPENVTGALLEVDLDGVDTNPNLFTIQCNWQPSNSGYVLKHVAQFRTLPDGEWSEMQEIPKDLAECRWTGKTLGQYQCRVASVDIYGKISPWAESPDITTVATALVNSTTTAEVPIVVIFARDTNLMQISLKNLSGSPIGAIAMRLITHSTWQVPGVYPSSVSDRSFVSLLGTDLNGEIGTSLHGFVNSNSAMPILYGSRVTPTNTVPINVGDTVSWCFNMNGFVAIQIYAITGSAGQTAAVKVWSKGAPMFGEWY